MTCGMRHSSVARAPSSSVGRWKRLGGIAVETVTEDAHTALKLNRLGYNTAYLAIPQAAGLATEKSVCLAYRPAYSLGTGNGTALSY